MLFNIYFFKFCVYIGCLFVGPEHYLTQEVYHDLSELTVVVKYHPSRPPDTRNDDLPVSSLSWHNNDLAKLQKRIMRRVKVKNGSVSRSVSSARSDSTLCSSSVKNLSIVVVRKPKSEKKYRSSEKPEDIKMILGSKLEDSASSTRAVTPQPGRRHADTHVRIKPRRINSNHDSSCVYRPGSGKLAMMEVLTNGKSHVHYDHSEVATSNSLIDDKSTVKMLHRYYSVHKQQLSPSSQVGHVSLPHRPHSVQSNSPTASAINNTHSSITSSAKSRQTHSSLSVCPLSPSTVQQPFSEISPYSSLTSSPHAPSSAIHRQRCSIPSAHAITPDTVASAVTLGPHCSVVSLLGPKPCPRRLSQTHHSSAWYQMPARYRITALDKKPYPWKQLPKNNTTSLVIMSPQSVSKHSTMDESPSRNWSGTKSNISTGIY